MRVCNQSIHSVWWQYAHMQRSRCVAISPTFTYIQMHIHIRITQKPVQELTVLDDTDLTKATGLQETQEESGLRLNRVYQLTGFSDPIYAEAYVNVHQYDIVLDVTVINQTTETLQNVSLELATLGDLKLVERPQNYTIAPHGRKNIKANIKVIKFYFYSDVQTGIFHRNRNHLWKHCI